MPVIVERRGEREKRVLKFSESRPAITTNHGPPLSTSSPK